jgi:plasmid stabilization system protein ParE
VNLRPPGSHRRKPAGNALDYEMAQEQAAALGRLGRALEAALAALSEHDRAGPDCASAAGTRERLVGEAGYALWCFIVQREACGLRDQRLIIRDNGVPREVQNRMGVLGPGSRPRRI